jgi:integrase
VKNQTQALEYASVLQYCKAVRLPTVGANFVPLAEQAVKENHSHIRYLEALLAIECEERDRHAIESRVRDAQLPRMKTLEEFDFAQASQIPAARIRELAEGGYIERKEPIVLIGECGTGKTHLATGLCLAACRQKRRVRFTTAAALVSELVGLQIDDMMLQPQASVLIHGKGRKERCLPLWKETASAVRAWLSVRGEAQVPELFLNARNDDMTRAGFEYILRKHVHAAETRCPSLSSKRISPHVLRHTCALTILQATKDLRKVSLWLGHSSMQTTEIYTRADPSVKLEALESVIAPKLRTGRFKATDKLIALLKAAPIMRSKKTTR